MSKILLRSRHAALGGGLAMPAILHSPLIMTGAYANVITGLMPHLYAALEAVSREMVGMIPNVSRNATMERAALHQPVTFPVSGPIDTVDITPSMSIPEPPDREFGSRTVMITKAKTAPFGFVGEEQRALASGVGHLTLQAQNIAQAMRALVNDVERDLFRAGMAAASRATGTAGTPALLNGVGDSAQLRKILDDNGAPRSGRALVVNSGTAANIRTNTQLTKVNEAGDEGTLRRGTLGQLHGFMIDETGANATHIAGTADSATTNAAGYAVGATTITLASAGTGTIVPGDVITFAGDANKYVVVSGDADVSGGGTITIQQPGLRVAIPASATAITRSASYEANIAFSPDAIVVAMRAPAVPVEGDAAVDSYLLTDPVSGVTFDIRVYLGNRKVRYEVGLAWGWATPNERHIALLMS